MTQTQFNKIFIITSLVWRCIVGLYFWSPSQYSVIIIVVEVQNSTIILINWNILTDGRMPKKICIRLETMEFHSTRQEVNNVIFMAAIKWLDYALTLFMSCHGWHKFHSWTTMRISHRYGPLYTFPLQANFMISMLWNCVLTLWTVDFTINADIFLFSRDFTRDGEHERFLLLFESVKLLYAQQKLSANQINLHYILLCNVNNNNICTAALIIF